MADKRSPTLEHPSVILSTTLFTLSQLPAALLGSSGNRVGAEGPMSHWLYNQARNIPGVEQCGADIEIRGPARSKTGGLVVKVSR
jgi:hypothetical protein